MFRLSAEVFKRLFVCFELLVCMSCLFHCVDYLFGCLDILPKCLGYLPGFLDCLCRCVGCLSDSLNCVFGYLDILSASVGWAIGRSVQSVLSCTPFIYLSRQFVWVSQYSVKVSGLSGWLFRLSL